MHFNKTDNLQTTRNMFLDKYNGEKNTWNKRLRTTAIELSFGKTIVGTIIGFR